MDAETSTTATADLVVIKSTEKGASDGNRDGISESE